jgi:S-adenosylmethionine hydrolase
MSGTVAKYSQWIGVYLLSAAGCVSVSPMDAGLKALIGEDVSTAIAVLGKPSAMEGLGEVTVYAWSTRRTEVRPETHTTDSFGGAMTNMTVRTTVNVQYEYYCNVQILVNSTGRITNTAHDGDRNGCHDYGKVLENYAGLAQAERQEKK